VKSWVEKNIRTWGHSLKKKRSQHFL